MYRVTDAAYQWKKKAKIKNAPVLSGFCLSIKFVYENKRKLKNSFHWFTKYNNYFVTEYWVTGVI